MLQAPGHNGPSARMSHNLYSLGGCVGVLSGILGVETMIQIMELRSQMLQSV